MILKASKMGFEKENHAVMVIIVAFGLNICEGLLGGGVKLFLNIYISMIIQNLIVKFHI